MTKREAWRRGTAALLAAGVADAHWQAELLLRGALRESRARFLASLSEDIAQAELCCYFSWVARRRQGEPVQYLVGTQEFMGLPIGVTPAVLIPRPDTEILVEEAVRLLREHRAPWVADLATGSGAIALALASRLPEAQVFATDISPAALQVAMDNAARLCLADRIGWRLGSWTLPLAGAVKPGAGWQAIVANPPYIPSAEIASLSREVQQEPHLALDGGSDGLDCYRELIPQAAALLAPGGYLLLEVGAGQAGTVRELMQSAGLAQVYAVCDLAGIERVVVGTARR